MKKILLILSVISFELKSEVVPLPPAISSVDDIVNEFRNSLVIKINDLSKNFISRSTDSAIFLTNSSVTKCNNETIQSGEPLAKIQYSYKLLSNELRERVTYFGCQNQVVLYEDIVTRGENLNPAKFGDIVKGKRDIDTSENETYRLYTISNSNNQEIFKILIDKSENKKLVEMYFIEQKIFRMNFDFKLDSTRLTLTYYPFKASYSVKNSFWKFNSSFNSFSNTAISTNKNGSVQTSYFDNKGIQITQKDFLLDFDDFIISGSIARLRSIIDTHNTIFPETQIVQTGSTNDHFKEELRLAFNRLQNNTELNLVKKQIQDYIEAVENGLIVDKRPKEQ